MRIDELSRKDEVMQNWRSVKQVQSFLKSNGYKRLGKGVFSEVWGQPGAETVIKVSTSEDTCWLRYAKWAMKQPDNPHLPKIYSLKTYKTRSGTLFVARMEKLTEAIDYFTKYLDRVGREKDPKRIGAILWVGLLGYDNVQDMLHDSSVLRSLANSTVRKQYFPDATVPQIVTHLLSAAKRTKLAQTVKQAHTYILKNPMCYEDLHLGNVMMRGETVVIMDPAAMYENG